MHPAVEALTVDIWMLPKQHRLPGSDIRIRGMPARSLTLPFAVTKWQSGERFSTATRPGDDCGNLNPQELLSEQL